MSITKHSFFKFNEDVLREPVQILRSSAVFYFIHDGDTTTEIHFMNYWREKKSIVDIEMKITLRELGGKTFFQTSSKIESKGSYILKISELLKQSQFNNKISQGSIEVEFFSKDNMVFAFPAALVRYVGKNWHTLSHTTPRYFSESSGDGIERLSQIQQAEEGNITINNSDEYEPFFIIHNGPKQLSKTNIEIKITALDGTEISETIKDVDWNPYQTRVYSVDDYLDYKKFLKTSRGMLTVKYQVCGVFPRLIGGNKSKKTGSWSIDHSNFAANSGSVLNDVFDVSKNQDSKDLVFCIPNNFKDKWECFADIYPTYPDDDYTILINKIKPNGDVSSESLKLKKHSTNGFPRIQLFDEANYEIIFKHARKLPRRFHMGIHYKTGSGDYGFLTDGPLPISSFPNTTRWWPILDPVNCKNFVMIANRVLGHEKPSDVKLNFKLFNSFDEDPLVSKYHLLANQSVCLNIDELFPRFENYLHKKSGWVYMTSENPFRCVVHYASVKNNSIAVCHAF